MILCSGGSTISQMGEGAPNPQCEYTSLLFGQSCPENCMKMKEIGTGGGEGRETPMDPPNMLWTRNLRWGSSLTLGKSDVLSRAEKVVYQMMFCYSFDCSHTNCSHTYMDRHKSYLHKLIIKHYELLTFELQTRLCCITRCIIIQSHGSENLTIPHPDVDI